MGTICATLLLRCLVDLDVLDNQVAGIQALGIGICFCVLEEGEEMFGGLDGPAGTGDTELFACYNTRSVSYPHKDVFP